MDSDTPTQRSGTSTQIDNTDLRTPDNINSNSNVNINSNSNPNSSPLPTSSNPSSDIEMDTPLFELRVKLLSKLSKKDSYDFTEVVDQIIHLTGEDNIESVIDNNILLYILS